MRLLAFILMLFAVGAQAASPTFQQFNTDQFGTTGNRVIIKPGSLQTNNIIYGDVAVGQLTVPALFNIYGTNRFWDTSGATSAKLWFEDPYFVFDQSISVPGINLNGVFRTTWPSGGAGDQTPWTSDINGATFSLTNMSMLVISNKDVASPFMTMAPAADAAQRGTGGLLWGVGYYANAGGDSNVNKVFVTGGFNVDRAGNQIDGREPSAWPVMETWWNGAGVEPEGHQMEIYWAYRAPSNAISFRPMGMVLRGTNSMQHTIAGSSWTFNGYRSPHSQDQLLISDGSPGTTNGGVSIIAAGVLTLQTNASNSGGIEVEGGTIRIGGPDSVSANNMILRVDWNNGIGSKPHAFIYSSGVPKALYIGDPVTGANGFTNIVFTTNVLAFNGVQASNGFKSSIGIFTKMPTNTPAIHQIIAASDTLGNTHWTNPPTGGGSGDTNALSYINGTDPQYAAVSIEAMHRLNLWFTNSFRALAVINSGGNSEVAVYGNAAGAQIASFQDSGGFIGSGAWELRAGSDGDAHIAFTDSGTTIYDNEENPIFDFSNIGVPYVEQIAGTYADFKGHTVHTNGTLAISPLLGTVAADNAPAGTYGEYVESVIASGSAVSLTDATAANITSISLTAGDWDVEGNVNLLGTGATFTAGASGINTTSATLPTTGKANFVDGDLTGNFTEGMSLSRVRVNVSATTTVYLVGRATFSAGTVTGYGAITARRIR